MLISPDDTVKIMIDKSEMGQGILTALCMIAAEELECDWKKIRTEFAPAAKEYFNPAFGMQGTGGSSSVRSSWDPMRKAGAAARDMLLQAAAQKVGRRQIRVPRGKRRDFPRRHEAQTHLRQRGRSGVKASRPAGRAAQGPETIPHRRETHQAPGHAGQSEWPRRVRVGRAPPGNALRGGARCPVFGGKVASFDATKAKAVPGVKNVVQISAGIAVVADNTWNAMQGRRALDVKWDEGPNADVTQRKHQQAFRGSNDETRRGSAQGRRRRGGAFRRTQKLEAVYEAPYLAHATMEPMNCTADVRADRVDVWAPTQFQTMAQATAAKICGLKPEAAFIHTTYLGGGFGRKAGTDFVIEAVEISKAIGAPVKLTWSREDDTQHDYYRPASYARMAGAIGADGWPVAWTTRIACPSIMEAWFPGSTKNNLDPTSVEGVANLPYSIPNILVDYVRTEPGIPVGFWRSVGSFAKRIFQRMLHGRAGGRRQKRPLRIPPPSAG